MGVGIGLMLGILPAQAQVVLSSFENDLTSSVGANWEGVWTTDPTFTELGATDGSTAFAVQHAPTWVTDGTILRGGLELAEVTAQHNFLLIDATTSDLGEAGDGWSPSYRQVFVIFNSNQGGWQQTQIDFTVAGDDGGSLTETLILDLESTGIKANAQAFVDAGGGDMTYWELFLVFQGEDQGQIRAGDYNDNGEVDAADFVTWRDSFGGTVLTNETVSPGIVDDEDYDEWVANFGTNYTQITTVIDNIRFVNVEGASATVAGVPEPSTVGLVLLAVLGFAGGRRRLAAQ
jgi:hypothetical protein